VHAAEDDVLGVGPGSGLLGELERVAGDVGERDDLVALVVVPQHEDAVAEGGLRRAGALDQSWVGRRREVAGAVDTALGGRVALAAEQQQRQRRRLDAGGQVEVGGGRHDRVLSGGAGMRRKDENTLQR